MAGAGDVHLLWVSQLRTGYEEIGDTFEFVKEPDGNGTPSLSPIELNSLSEVALGASMKGKAQRKSVRAISR